MNPLIHGLYGLYSFYNGLYNGLYDGLYGLYDGLYLRMKYVHFNRPAPPRQGKGPKPCAFCWSRWVLLGQLYWLRESGQPLDEFMTRVANALEPTEPHLPASTRPRLHHTQHSEDSQMAAEHEPLHEPGQFYHKLSNLIEWYRLGHLTQSEFIEAKRRLGLH